MDEGVKILNINPVFPVRNIEETMDYYINKLGFKLAFEDYSDGTKELNYAGVFRGNICIHFQTFHGDQNPTMPLVRIRVENIKELHKEYLDSGVVKNTEEVKPKPWGQKEFGLYDNNKAGLIFYEETQ